MVVVSEFQFLVGLAQQLRRVQRSVDLGVRGIGPGNFLAEE